MNAAMPNANAAPTPGTNSSLGLKPAAATSGPAGLPNAPMS